MTRRTVIEAIRRTWPVSLPAALGLSIAFLALVSSNRYGVYPTARLIWVPLLLLPAFLTVAWGTDRYFFPFWKRTTRRQRLQLILILSIGLLAAFWLLPVPLPDVRQDHELVISATGEKQDSSAGSMIEIRRLAFLNGQSVPLDRIARTPDWQESDGILFTTGAPGSRIVIEGDMPGGLIVDLRYYLDGGKVVLTWDGEPLELDLFSRESTIIPYVLRSAFFELPAGSMLLAGGLTILSIFGLLVLLLGLVALVDLRFQWPAEVGAYLLAALVIVFVFINLKLSYLEIDSPRVFRDTLSYVQTGEKSFSSPSFWMGDRAFTTPLFYKMLGSNSANFESPEQMLRVARAQLFFSIFSWLVLALILAVSTGPKILRLILMFVVLFFSLSLEVSLWDSLMLSESVSFSLFALLLATWTALLVWLPRTRSVWLRWSLIAITCFLSVLLAFTRDSNTYYLLLATAVLLVGFLTNRSLARYRTYVMVYAGFIVALVVAQYFALSHGDRWKIYIYDHLSMRILLDEKATRFFAEQGLPITDRLMQTTSLPGHEFQPLYFYDPEFQPVREWVAISGKSAYIKYLLSRPWQTLIEPVEQAAKLITGSNLEYRSPKYGVWPAPERLLAINCIFFGLPTWGRFILALTGMVGTVIYLRNRRNPLWILLAANLLCIYPMMFIIWHGEPMEIERHAAQVTMQFQFTGWLSAVFLLAEWIPGAIRKSRQNRAIHNS